MSVSLFRGEVGIAETAGQGTDRRSGVDLGFPRDYVETPHVALCDGDFSYFLIGSWVHFPLQAPLTP